MRDAIVALGGDPARINPLQPVDLVIDHSVQVDEYGTEAAALINVEHGVRAQQRALRVPQWGQQALAQLPRRAAGHRHLPPGEPRVPRRRWCSPREEDGETLAYCDSLVGTDSHTTMINGLGVLGWGVGGIEAEAAMLGQPVSMLIPEVIGFKLARQAARRRDGHRPRAHLHRDAPQEEGGRQVRGVLRPRPLVALARRPRDDRQHGPRVRRDDGLLPRRRRDAQVPAPHRPQRRSRSRSSRRTARRRGSSAPTTRPTREFTDTLALDLSTVEPSLAGPKRPQDRVPLSHSKRMFREALASQLASQLAPRGGGGQAARPGRPRRTMVAEGAPGGAGGQRRAVRVSRPDSSRCKHGARGDRRDHACTNTVEPERDAGGRAARAEGRGARAADASPWVKTSLAPGSKVVTEYFNKAGVHAGARRARLQHRRLRLHHVHRQLGPAPGADQRGDRRAASSTSPRCSRATATSKGA